MTQKDFFEKNGYAVVRNALSNELRDFITQYALFDEMQNFQDEQALGLYQVPNAHSKYADPAMEVTLLQLHNVMEQNTGLKLFPTYSYYRVYRSGDTLEPHTDRPSCEISCTMCFNFNYDNSEYTWPIYMAGNKVELNPGDLVIYRGCDLEHWREPFDVGDDVWQVQGFFHYVDQNGPKAEWKWDKRQSIGQVFKHNRIQSQESERVLKPYIKYL